MTRLPLRTTLTSLAFVVAASTPTWAQNLTLYDGLDYGVTATSPGGIGGKNGGFGWGDCWIGADLGGLASWWPLDNSATDAGPMGAHGILVGGQFLLETPSQAIWSTHSLRLQSSNKDYIDLSAHASKFNHLMCGSITAWVRTTRQNGATIILGAKRSGSAGKKLIFFLQSGFPRYYVQGDLLTGSFVQGFFSVADGAWHHLALSVDCQGIVAVYADGQWVAGGPSGFFGHVHAIDGMWIGQLPQSRPSRLFDGEIDDVAIWGNALTQSEVQRLASIPPPLLQPQSITTGPLLATESLASASRPNGAFGTAGLAAAGNRLSDNQGLITARALASPIDFSASQTIYLSCLVRLNSYLGNQGFEVQLTDESGPRCRFGWNAQAQWTAGLNQTRVGAWMQVGQTYFAVLKIVTDATANDAVYLKVYGPSERVHTDDGQLSGMGTGANEWTVLHDTESSSRLLDSLVLEPKGTALVEVDELRMGTTWEAVTSLGYGAGCLGTSIGKANRPALGSTDFDVRLLGASPSAAAILCLGGSRTLWGALPLPLDLSSAGAPGCTVLASIDSVLPTLTGGAGTAALTLPLPNQPALIGTALFAQWASADQSRTNALPLAFSNAMEIVLEQ